MFPPHRDASGELGEKRKRKPREHIVWFSVMFRRTASADRVCRVPGLHYDIS